MWEQFGLSSPRLCSTQCLKQNSGQIEVPPPMELLDFPPNKLLALGFHLLIDDRPGLQSFAPSHDVHFAMTRSRKALVSWSAKDACKMPPHCFISENRGAEVNSTISSKPGIETVLISPVWMLLHSLSRYPSGKIATRMSATAVLYEIAGSAALVIFVDRFSLGPLLTPGLPDVACFTSSLEVLGSAKLA